MTMNEQKNEKGYEDDHDEECEVHDHKYVKAHDYWVGIETARGE